MQSPLNGSGPTLLKYYATTARSKKAARRIEGATRMLHFFGGPLHMIAAHRVATRGQ
jgi:hypothetical protein